MNLLRVISSMNPEHGGPCQGIRNIVPALARLGVHNEVVSLDDPAASFLGKDSFPIHALGPWKSSWKSSERLIPWLEQNVQRFDAIVIHGLWLFHGYAVSKVFEKIKSRRVANSSVPKLFVMPHGMLDPYFQRASERKLKAVRNWLYWKVIESKVVNSADGVLFTCEAELLLARETFHPYFPKRELNVGYGIEAPPAFNPRMHQTFLRMCPGLGGKPYILFLSRIHEKKGVDLLLRAFIECKNQSGFANASLSLVIAGPGLDTPYGRSLQLLAEENGMKDFVFFPGMLSGEAKWGAFYGCEAFVLPSHQENFGISVAEALACSRAVLISNQVNIWKEIKNGGGGLVYDDTLEGTRNLLKDWMNLSPQEKQAMGEKAGETFMNNFTITQSAARFTAVLSSVVIKKKLAVEV
jgi:glycosyltransferase involved in cell wall biosynthesis